MTKAFNFFRRCGPKKLWDSTVWKAYLQPSHRITLWMLAQRRLPTKDRQAYLEDTACTFCGRTEETQEHIPHKGIVETSQGMVAHGAGESSFQQMLRVYK